MTAVYKNLLGDRLEKRRANGLYRALITPEIDLIDFTSNDYFGFSRSKELAEEASRLTSRIGATGSRLLTGNYSLYREMEQKLAHFHHAESALIFNTGYQANLGLLAAIGNPETTFIYDLESHASIYDGMRLSRAKCLPFRHNNLDSLERRLQKATPPVFVLIESIYSISGDIAPLREIADLSTRYGAMLIVDEAHATGIRGLNGEGLVTEYGQEDQVFARVHTFSKTIGVHGAAVLGNQILKDYLVNFSRPFIYTTALPPFSLAMIGCAYDKLQKEAKHHQYRLQQLIHYFQHAFKTPIVRDGPIQSLYSSSVEKVKELSQILHRQGLDVRAILPPTSPQGKPCLRIVLHSFNHEKEIDLLCASLSLASIQK